MTQAVLSGSHRLCEQRHMGTTVRLQRPQVQVIGTQVTPATVPEWGLQKLLHV